MCGGPAWKREVVADHKFDFVDTREFTSNSAGMRMKYLWLYVIVLKSFLVYVSDIFSAITMLTTHAWSNQIYNECQVTSGCIFIKFEVGKWLFVGAIIFGFLLLAYESRKAKKIIASRDISYAFTNVIANNYYSLRSYDHFCFFDHISNSTTKKDDFAFFIFFTFKSWKRLLLADAPRQTINALTLYSIYLVKQDNGAWYYVPKYFTGNSVSTSALIASSFFTFVIFAGSLLLLIVAGICYIPLLCYIRGNLKEYCCHKVDKRIAQIIKRRNKERLAKALKHAKKEAMGDYSHLKNKKGEMIAKPLPQPTLPNLSVEDDFDDASSVNTKGPTPSVYTNNTQDHYYASDYKSDYPPPMPAYNPQVPGVYPGYNQSPQTYASEDQYQQYHYEEDYGSSQGLPPASQPYAQRHASNGSALTNPHGSVISSAAPQYVADPHDVYQGRAQVPTSLSPPPAQHRPRSDDTEVGLAYYDDGQNHSTSHHGHGQDPYAQQAAPYSYSDYYQQQGNAEQGRRNNGGGRGYADGYP